MATVATTRMTIEELRLQRCYLDLTPKMKLLVEGFIASGDRLFAVQSAYDFQDLEVARTNSYRLFENPRVVACLAAFYQNDPLESFKEQVLRAARNRRLSIAQLGAMKLVADLNGWGAGSLSKSNGRASVLEHDSDHADVVGPDSRVPAEATALIDDLGVIRGYRTPEGEYVQLAAVEASK